MTIGGISREAFTLKSSSIRPDISTEHRLLKTQTEGTGGIAYSVLAWRRAGKNYATGKAVGYRACKSFMAGPNLVQVIHIASDTVYIIG